MSSPPSTSGSGSIPSVQLAARLYALLRSEKAQGASTTPSASAPPPPLGGYSGLPASFGFGQPHPLVAAAAQAALSAGAGNVEYQAQKFEDLQSALTQLRRYADTLPGGDYSPEDQIWHMKILKEQIRVKSELLAKFKELGAAGLLEPGKSAVPSVEKIEPTQ